MRRSALLAGAAACFLVTAGCLGVFGDESTQTAPAASPPPDSSSTERASPTGTRTVTPTRAAMSLPAEMGDSAVNSPGEFADTHRATLGNASFTARYSYVRRVDGAVTTRTHGIVRYDGAGTVYLNSTTRDPLSGGFRRVETWSNGSVARRAVTTSDGRVTEEADPEGSLLTFAGRVDIYLRAFETGVTGYSRLAGEPVVRLSGSEFNREGSGDLTAELAFRFGIGDVDDGRLSAVLESDALRRYRVEIVDRRPSNTITVAETLTITRPGPTTIQRPEWVTPGNRSRPG